MNHANRIHSLRPMMSTRPMGLDPQRQLPNGASVLVIDDSPAIRSALTTTLNTLGMFSRIQTAADGFAGYQAMLEHKYDVVLCDLHMPKCDGINFLKLRSANQGLHNVPVIVLTGSTDQESKIQALELGACDYVGKAAAPAELGARITVHVRLKNLHDDLMRKTAELERLCSTDPLTGMQNRRSLRGALDAELARAARYGRTVSFAMIDIDRFKQLNDEHGHQAGDQVLMKISTMLMGTVRKQDLVARFGGEEIAIMLPETGLHSAGLLAERMRKMISELTIEWEGKTIQVTASIGVASVGSSHTETSEGLIRAADRALYAAKNAGRNRVMLAGSDVTPVLVS